MGWICIRCCCRCPPPSAIDSSEDPALYDEEVIPSSPILKEAAIKLPSVDMQSWMFYWLWLLASADDTVVVVARQSWLCVIFVNVFCSVCGCLGYFVPQYFLDLVLHIEIRLYIWLYLRHIMVYMCCLNSFTPVSTNTKNRGAKSLD